MPHFNNKGEEEWVCQKGGHICTGDSTWVEKGTEFAKQMGCFGNVCERCLKKSGFTPPKDNPPIK